MIVRLCPLPKENVKEDLKDGLEESAAKTLAAQMDRQYRKRGAAGPRPGGPRWLPKKR
jgi:hypothetical protein